ncbi:MAG: MarR family winged helix-turn-helix transcriptional regulator [Pseudomonadota bacterium]
MNDHTGFDTEFDQRSFITFRLASVQNALNAQAGRVLKSHCNLTLTEWRVLLLIDVWDMAQMSDMTRLAGLDKGQVSRSVKSLTAKGYVASGAAEDDARAQHLSVTESGHALQRRVLPHMLSRQERLVRDIDADEMRIFNKVLDRLADGAKLDDF